jgi:mannose-6-phosphate isomerase-like protein (cupin superfamily)
METEATSRAKPYSLRTQQISKGKFDGLMARGDLLEVRLKIYAEGGENTLHAHYDHDHTFIVLDGQATFYDEEDEPTVVNPYEGIFLPMGAKYRFCCSSGETPVVLLRIGGGERTDDGQFQRSVGKKTPRRQQLTEDDPYRYDEGAVLVPGKFVGS